MDGSKRRRFVSRNFGSVAVWLALALAEAGWGETICATDSEAAAGMVSAAERIEGARRTLARGIPEVAAARLQGVNLEDLPETLRTEAQLLLAQALTNSDRAAEALEILGTQDSAEPAAAFWRGRALAALHRWDDSAAAYAVAADDPGFSMQGEAVLGRAVALRNAGRLEEAVGLLEPATGHPQLGALARLQLAEFLIEKQDYGGAQSVLEGMTPGDAAREKQRLYLQGQIALAAGDATAAQEAFQTIAQSREHTTPALWAGAHLGRARALRQLGELKQAESVLELFIRENANSPELAGVFAELDAIYAEDRSASLSELVRWSRDVEGPRRLLAELYLARAEVRRGERRRAIDRMQAARDVSVDESELHRDLLTELGWQELAHGRPGHSIEVFLAAQPLDPDPDFQAWTEFMLGRAAFELARYEEAAQRFDAASGRAGMEKDALYNAALTRLRLGDYGGFLERYAAFSKRYPDDVLRSNLVLERGLHLARTGGVEAAEALATFARDFPEHPAAPRARIALAEFLFARSPPDFDGASQALKEARENGLAEHERLRADLLEIWIDDAGGSDVRASIARLAALAQAADLIGAPELGVQALLKQGELLFRIDDFGGARSVFEAVAASDADEGTRRMALFLAARSAARSMDAVALDEAVEYYEDVARHSGDRLVFFARLEQAGVKTLQERYEDALILYDELLKQEEDPQRRFQVAMGKGSTLMAAGRNDPGRLDEAVAAYEAAAGVEKLGAAERNEALYMRGQALERVGREEEALAAYYDVMDRVDAGEYGDEFFWVYRAGFDAGRLLERQQRWDSAIAVYERLEVMDGPRSEEARERVNQLRLEHFLWES